MHATTGLFANRGFVEEGINLVKVRDPLGSRSLWRILPLDFAMVIAGAILVCFVATIYPSRQAAKLDPAQALRYE